jgi:hypothetical protein
MSDEVEHEEGESSARGEAAWKEARERIAERNHAARKAGKQRREAYERQREEARRAAERERHSILLARRRTP